jgi:hypothetical protein
MSTPFLICFPASLRSVKGVCRGLLAIERRISILFSYGASRKKSWFMIVERDWFTFTVGDEKIVFTVYASLP